MDIHRGYVERQALYKSFGYDIDKEREFVLNQAGPVSGRILEAGTGKGYFALALAMAGYHVTTFDISAEEQAVAKLHLSFFGLDRQVDFHIENGERTSFADQSFDIVFSVNVLHHLQHPYLVLDELIRLVSFDGKLILADFTEEGFKMMDKIYSLEGCAHEVGKLTLSNAGAYLQKKGFSVRMTKSEHQRVLVALRREGPTL